MGVGGLPPNAPVWAVGVFSVLLLISVASKQVSELKGPAGALARWWRERQLRQIDHADSLEARIEASVERRVRTQMEPLEHRIQALESDLSEERAARRRDRSRFEEKLRDRDEEIRLLQEWGTEAVRREWTLDQWAASRGLQLPPPPFAPFEEWRRDRGGQ